MESNLGGSLRSSEAAAIQPVDLMSDADLRMNLIEVTDERGEN